MFSAPPKLLRLVAALCLGLIFVSACGDSANPKQRRSYPAYKYNLSVRVTTAADDVTQKQPVHSIPILVDDKVVGYTDKDGAFEAILAERPGKTVKIEAGEVDEYIYVGDRVLEQKLGAKLVAQDKLETKMISFHTEVSSIRTKYLVWVKLNCSELEASCANLPIKVNNEIVASTDAIGRAQFPHIGAPGQVLDVTIDASELKNEEDAAVDLITAQPVYSIELDKNSTMYLVDAKLEPKPSEETAEETPKKKKVSKKRRTTRRPKKRTSRVKKKRPAKKRRPKKKKPKKKKSYNSGPIDIFAD